MMPLTELESYPFFDATTVYVSGASEMNVNLPSASVLAVAVCEGLEMETAAPSMGAFVAASVKVPVISPVVPARTHVPWTSRTRRVKTASALRKIDLRIRCLSYDETLRSGRSRFG
ncbi:MAG TPA: hypothetical protein VGC96_04575 [Candidatus Elarobacter sp.]